MPESEFDKLLTDWTNNHMQSIAEGLENWIETHAEDCRFKDLVCIQIDQIKEANHYPAFLKIVLSFLVENTFRQQSDDYIVISQTMEKLHIMFNDGKLPTTGKMIQFLEAGSKEYLEKISKLRRLN